jgi:Tol biopolymer transport system component
MTIAERAMLYFTLSLIGVPTVTGGVLKQVTDTKHGSMYYPAIDDNGTTVYGTSNNNEFGDNPEHLWQIFKWDVASGLGSKLTNLPGLAVGVSVSDDAQWLAFTSTGDMLPELNIDHSTEVFVMRTDGSGLRQLTNVVPPMVGECYGAEISGSGNRVAFLATANLTGSNPANNLALFVIDIDGKNLRQLTPSLPFDESRPHHFAISDDGSRLLLVSSHNYLGTNPDRSEEVFVVNSNGTSFRQLTSFPSGFVSVATLSGNGNTVIYSTSHDQVAPIDPFSGQNLYAINFDGSNRRQVTNLLWVPTFVDLAVTDSGQQLHFVSDARFSPAVNPTGVTQLWRCNLDGSGLQQLSFVDDTYFAGVRSSGSGNRVTTLTLGPPPYSSTYGSFQLNVSNPDASNARELINVKGGEVHTADLDRGFTRMAFVSSDDPLGTNPAHTRLLWSARLDGSELRQLTLGPGFVDVISCSGDCMTIAYEQQVGGGASQVHSIRADGTLPRQLTSGSAGATNPAISRDATVIVFQSSDDLDDTEPPGSTSDVFSMSPDGTGLTRYTTRPTDSGFSVDELVPRVSATGQWIVYSSNDDSSGSNADRSYEIYRVNRDRSVRQQISSAPAGRVAKYPDVSGNGRLIAFVFNADPLGTNPELNDEVFVYDAELNTLRQLTTASRGSIFKLRIDELGNYVHFITDAPLAEFDPLRTRDTYRVRISDAKLERLSGITLRRGSSIAVVASQDGANTAFVASGVQAGANLDLGPELFLSDHELPAEFRINPNSETIISWQAEPGVLRYDAIRGDVANLSYNTDGSVNLGAVECLDNESVDLLTEKFREQEDPNPFPGTAKFFLRRPNLGLNFELGTWGTDALGNPRRPEGGSCPD